VVLAASEGRRDGLVIATAAMLALVFFAVAFYPELSLAAASIPTGASYFTDAFSARNLPFGFAEALGKGVARSLIAGSLLAALSGVAVARMLRTARLLGREQLDWAPREARLLVIGGLLVAACFFAGQNIGYRGILLLPVLSGLVRLHRSVEDREARRFCLQMIAAVLFVMWGECFRRGSPRRDLPGPQRGAELARRGVLLARPGAGMVVAGCRARCGRSCVPPAIAFRGDFRKNRRRSCPFFGLTV